MNENETFNRVVGTNGTTYYAEDTEARESISDIMEVMPAGATAQNLLATQNDVENAVLNTLGLSIVNGQLCVTYYREASA